MPKRETVVMIPEKLWKQHMKYVRRLRRKERAKARELLELQKSFDGRERLFVALYRSVNVLMK